MEKIFTNAVFCNECDTVEELLEAGADVNYEPENCYNTILIIAICHNYEEIIKIFLKYNVDVEKPNDLKRTPLSYAVENNNINITELLLKYGANPNFDSEFFNYLKIAVEKNYYDITILLLKYGANVNYKDRRCETILMRAAYHNHEKITKILLDNGADITIKNDRDEYILENIISIGHCTRQIIKILKDHCEEKKLYHIIEDALEYIKLNNLCFNDNKKQDIINILMSINSDSKSASKNKLIS